MDHLSEFFIGRWPSEGFGEIRPDGGGSGADERIEQLGLSEGDKLGYVYDFGDEIHHVITLEKIAELKKRTKYPRIVSKSKPRYSYCESCEKQGKKHEKPWSKMDKKM